MSIAIAAIIVSIPLWLIVYGLDLIFDALNEVVIAVRRLQP